MIDAEKYSSDITIKYNNYDNVEISLEISVEDAMALGHKLIYLVEISKLKEN